MAKHHDCVQFSSIHAAYVNNDPVNWVDPWGLSAEDKKQTAETHPNNNEASRFIWPLENNYITSAFGKREGVEPGSPHHNGIDLRAPTGTPVYASGDGIVTVADLEYSGSRRGHSYLIINDKDGYAQRYLHMDRFDVKKGDKITQGQKLGVTGTRKNIPPHLHFEIRKNGKPIDPVTVLPKIPSGKTATQARKPVNIPEKRQEDNDEKNTDKYNGVILWFIIIR